MWKVIAGTLALIMGAPLHAASARADAFAEKSKSVVRVEYFLQREIDRQAGDAVGLLVSDDGLLVCLPSEFPDWVPPDRIRSIEVFPANNPLDRGLSATYLGQDWVNDWHYLRIDDWESAAPHLIPITALETGRPEIGDTVWGVCLTAEDLDYIPYYREGKLSAIHPLPLDTGFATTEVAVPGGPVFLADGRFCGWAGRALPMERNLWIGNDFFRANIINPDETHMFLLATPFLEEVAQRVPSSPTASQRPWIGVTGTQPLDKETSRFMGLTGQGVVVISEVLPDTPAAAAGLEDRDLILAINGQTLPSLKPDSVLQTYFERELMLKEIGQPFQLLIRRGDAEMELEVVPAKAPKSLKESPRHYVPDLGLSIREFLVFDAIVRRHDHRDVRGVVVGFVRPNSPAATAELESGDWILEISGQPVTAFETATALLDEAATDPDSTEVVLLIQRSGETAVLRVRKG
jgi:S1-C subfamily serine protease